MEQATFETTSSDGALHEFTVYMMPARQALPMLQRLMSIGGDSLASFVETAISAVDEKGNFDFMNKNFDASMFSAAVKELVGNIAQAKDMVTIVEGLLKNTTRDGQKFSARGKYDLDTFAGNWQELLQCLRHSLQHNYESFFSGLSVVQASQTTASSDD